jgi:hypothetical protein
MLALALPTQLRPELANSTSTNSGYVPSISYEVISTPTHIVVVLEYADGELFNYIVELKPASNNNSYHRNVDHSPTRASSPTLVFFPWGDLIGSCQPELLAACREPEAADVKAQEVPDICRILLQA